jgi:hypothetical protein
MITPMPVKDNNQKQTRRNAAITVASAVIVLGVVIGLPLWFLYAISSRDGSQVRDLEISIRTGGGAIQIKNNEPGDLRNCTVDINRGYTAKVDTIGGEYSSYDLSSFTKLRSFSTNRYRTPQRAQIASGPGAILNLTLGYVRWSSSIRLCHSVFARRSDCRPNTSPQQRNRNDFAAVRIL